MSREPRIGSLFTGTGALDQAARAVFGGRTVWCSDVKPAACTLLAQRLPDAPNHGDLTAIDFRTVEPVDILTGGWPCQPESAAGLRLGEEDPRALWPHVARAVDELRPAIFLGENVARIAVNGSLRRVVRDLAELGYVGAWRRRTASADGAPHKRERCFVLALRADVAERGRVFDRVAQGGVLELAPVGRNLPTPTKRDGKGAAPNRAGIRPDNGRTRGLGDLDLPGAVKLLPTPRKGDAIRGGGDARAAERAIASDPRRSSATGISLPRAVTLLADAQDWGPYVDAVRRWELVTGDPAPAPSTVGAKGQPQLSPAFVEWMMGLPRGWVTDLEFGRVAQLSLLGDGVVPLQAERAYRACLADLAAVHAPLSMGAGPAA